jgi:ethanolamine utilization protein EutA
MMMEREASRLTDKLLITSRFSEAYPLDGVVFSGGVSEYVYGTESREFGDLGPYLGQRIRSLVEDHVGAPILPARERIRATVIGTCQFTLQVSGDTIHVGQSQELPLRNIPVTPLALEGEITPEVVRETLGKALTRLDGLDRESPFALAIRLPPFRGYGIVEPLAQGICAALNGNGPPVVLVFEQNIARVVGGRLAEISNGRKFVCIDEVKVRDLDYMDVGAVQEGAGFVPVVIKSLVFQAPRLEKLRRV